MSSSLEGLFSLWFSVVDPGFPRRTVICKGVSTNLLFVQFFFPESCMKMKKKDRKGHTSLPTHPPPDPPMIVNVSSLQKQAKTIFIKPIIFYRLYETGEYTRSIKIICRFRLLICRNTCIMYHLRCNAHLGLFCRI